MAAPDQSTVVALCNKAFDLLQSGHQARCEEYNQRALTAAQAAARAPDCLIVSQLQLTLSLGLLSAAYGHILRRAPGAAPQFALPLTLFFEAAATLQRRKAASTLLAGSCRDAEVSWRASMDIHIAEWHRNNDMRAWAVELAPLVGYRAFLNASYTAEYVLSMYANGVMSLTQEQQRYCVAIMADAAELFMLPRNAADVLPEEGEFVERMRDFAKHPKMILRFGAAGARLLDSLRHLEQSEVHRRSFDVAVAAIKEADRKGAAIVAAAAAAPGLRHCALPSCGAREQHPAHFKSCAACRGVAYCCKEHQTEHWPAHKAACKAARKAAAAAEDTTAGPSAA